MDVINAKSNTYPFVEVVIYSEILRTNCRMNQSSSHLAMGIVVALESSNFSADDCRRLSFNYLLSGANSQQCTTSE